MEQRGGSYFRGSDGRTGFGCADTHSNPQLGQRQLTTLSAVLIIRAVGCWHLGHTSPVRGSEVIRIFHYDVRQIPYLSDCGRRVRFSARLTGHLSFGTFDHRQRQPHDSPTLRSRATDVRRPAVESRNLLDNRKT